MTDEKDEPRPAPANDNGESPKAANDNVPAPGPRDDVGGRPLDPRPAGNDNEPAKMAPTGRGAFGQALEGPAS